MKKRLLAALLAGLLLLSGCELITVNRARDRAQVVATIGSLVITKGELYDALQAELDMQGYSINLWDENMDESMRTQVDSYLKTYLDDYVNNKMMGIVCEKDYPLTDDEKKQIDTNVQSTIDYVKTMLGYDATDPSTYPGDIDKDVDSYLATMGTSREKLTQAQKESVEYTKVKDALMKDVAATDDQIKARYDKDLATQKSDFASGGSSTYETDVTTENLGDYALYKPTGYAIVKHILLSFTTADKTAYDNANTAVTDAQTAYNDVETSYTTAKTNVETAQKTITDAQAALTTAQQNNDQTQVASLQKTITDNTATVTDQTAVMNAQAKLLVDKNTALNKAKADFETVKKTVLKHYQTTIDTIKQGLAKGETFESLMAKYNKDDNGADSGVIAGLGYVISPNNSTYEANFASAALAATVRGLINDPVFTTYGVHIMYVMFTASEEVDIPYDLVKAVVKAKENDTVVGDAWNAKLTELRTQYGVQTWPSRVVYIHEHINQ